jgi:hypothetical protein
MDTHLKSLCLAVLTDTVTTDRFTNLLIKTGIKLDSIEWVIASRIWGKGDEIQHSLGQSRDTLH